MSGEIFDKEKETRESKIAEGLKSAAALIQKVLKKEKNAAKVSKFFGENSFLVVFYGCFVAVTAIFQCMASFFQLLADKYDYHGFFAELLNNNVHMPMGIIAWIWTGICAIYVGADRAAFAISSTQTGYNKPAVGHPERLRVIVWLSFWVYALCALLNLIFDVDLQLEPLASAFGSSVLLYVAGNKAIRACSALAKEDDLDGDGVADKDQDPVKVLQNIKETLKKAGKLADERDIDGDGILDSGQDAVEVLERIRKTMNGDGNTIVAHM
jgi:hypothetical protein